MSKYSKRKQKLFGKNIISRPKKRDYDSLNGNWREIEEIKSKEQKNADLLYYAKEGNKKLVKIALDTGRQAEIDVVDSNGNNALIIAAMNNNFDIVKFLIERGLDINSTGDVGTILHIYSRKNMCREVNWLLEHGADVNALGTYKQTPIYEAIMNNDQETMLLLMNYGAKINWYNREGYTPLMVAAQNRFRQNLIPALIKCGANTELVDANGNTALMHAIRAGNRPGFMALIKYSQINTKNRQGQTPLILACKRGDREVVRKLLELGADISVTDKHGKDAFHYAQINHHPQCCEIMQKQIKIISQQENNLQVSL